jgi:serine phosphatase RsbU (regulator of sigma subunit)
LIRNINAEIEEIKATKKAIGGFTDTNQYFEQHVISLNKDDSFYLFSDGYADQFGQNGKKLMTKKFKEILLSISSLGMNEQKKYLDDFIENWRSGIEQIDDILVIGVKL